MRVRAVQTLPRTLRKVPWARLLVLGELEMPDPEQVILTGIPLLRQVPHSYHRHVARFKSDVEDMLAWAGYGSTPLQNRVADFAVIWPTLLLGAGQEGRRGA